MTEAKFSQPIQPMIQPYFGSRHPTNLPAVVEDISEEINESKSVSMEGRRRRSRFAAMGINPVLVVIPVVLFHFPQPVGQAVETGLGGHVIDQNEAVSREVVALRDKRSSLSSSSCSNSSSSLSRSS